MPGSATGFVRGGSAALSRPRCWFRPKGAATSSSAIVATGLPPLATRRAREYSRRDVHHEGETNARSSFSRGGHPRMAAAASRA